MPSSTALRSNVDPTFSSLKASNMRSQSTIMVLKPLCPFCSRPQCDHRAWTARGLPSLHLCCCMQVKLHILRVAQGEEHLEHVPIIVFVDKDLFAMTKHNGSSCAGQLVILGASSVKAALRASRRRFSSEFGHNISGQCLRHSGALHYAPHDNGLNGLAFGPGCQ